MAEPGAISNRLDDFMTLGCFVTFQFFSEC